MNLPSFTQAVPDNGYHWWYLDAVSDGGEHALTVIAFIGSVFSPYYARARKNGGRRAALQHCSVNVALYGPISRWCMTERDHRSVTTSATALHIGNSSLSMNGRKLLVDINEITVPVPTRLCGQLSITLPDYPLKAHALDTDANGSVLHQWQPVAPQARIEVEMSKPGLQWQGSAYVDSNYGCVPLEKSFKSWTWSRSHGPDNRTTVLYDIETINGQRSQRSLAYDNHGLLTECDAPFAHTLKPTRYFRIPRDTRTPSAVTIGNLQTLEDTPFYSRSRFTEHHAQHQQVTVHESLDLQRFDTPWVRCLLPFRMPRTTRAVMAEPV